MKCRSRRSATSWSSPSGSLRRSGSATSRCRPCACRSRCSGCGLRNSPPGRRHGVPTVGRSKPRTSSESFPTGTRRCPPTGRRSFSAAASTASTATAHRPVGRVGLQIGRRGQNARRRPSPRPARRQTMGRSPVAALSPSGPGAGPGGARAVGLCASAEADGQDGLRVGSLEPRRIGRGGRTGPERGEGRSRRQVLAACGPDAEQFSRVLRDLPGRRVRRGRGGGPGDRRGGGCE